VRATRQRVKVSTPNDFPTEDFPKHLGWKESRHVQQRVSGALELDCGPLVFFNLLFQRQYRIEVSLPVHYCTQRSVRGCEMLQRFTCLLASTATVCLRG